MRVGARAAAGAFMRRDLRIGLSYKLPFLLEIFGAFFALLVTWFVAKIVEPGQVVGGYFAFVVLGLMVAAFVDAGVALVGGSLREQQMLGTLEAVLASGVPTRALAVGLAAYPLVSATFEAAVYGVLALLLGARAAGANWGLALAAIVLGAAAFAGVGLVGAALVLVLQRAAGAIGWLVAVLGLAAGEFFPPRLLPGWFRTLSLLSPFTWCLRLVRGSVLWHTEWSDGWRALAVLAVMAVVYAGIGVWALSVGLRWARRRGTLGGY